jgi:gluconate kinase
LGWVFLDADDFHPAANVEKLKRRVGHLAAEGMLGGRFADLEVPGEALVLRVGHPAEEIVGIVPRELRIV